MPIKPASCTYTCPSCGWSKTVSPKSDCMMPGDVFDSCPACSHAPLESRDGNMIQAALGNLAQQVKALLR